MPGAAGRSAGGAGRSQIPPPSRNAVNINAFHRFVSEHKDDPEFKDKYVAIVNGRYQKTGASKASLVQDMYDRFGYVKMCVGKVTTKPRVLYI